MQQTSYHLSPAIASASLSKIAGSVGRAPIVLSICSAELGEHGASRSCRAALFHHLRPLAVDFFDPADPAAAADGLVRHVQNGRLPVVVARGSARHLCALAAEQLGVGVEEPNGDVPDDGLWLRFSMGFCADASGARKVRRVLRDARVLGMLIEAGEASIDAASVARAISPALSWRAHQICI